MSEYNDYDDRKSVVLEGMYRGVEGKIEEVKDAVSKEVQFSSAQQASAYESLASDLREGLELLLREIRYLSQQSSAIHDDNKSDREAVKDELLEAVASRAEETEKALEKKFEAFKKDILGTLSGLPEETAKTDAAAVKAEPEEGETEGEAGEKPARAVRDPDDPFDYDVLAEKISLILPETDYDLIADKVVAALPQADADLIADKVAAAVPVADETAIADKVAETLPMLDYDLMGEHVAAALERDLEVVLDEAGVAAIADKVAETVADRVAERIAESVTNAVDCEKIAERVAAVLAEKLPAPAPAREIAATAAPAPAPAPVRTAPARPARPAPVRPVAVPVPEDPSLTTRYKRSFTAKIIESEEEVKEYYSSLKNELLSYGRVSSQINWSNDRFAYRGDTVAKIGVRGKTLCVYLALDPNEFPESTYHQKFAGDTKMYEKTPLMMKVKSGVALKRTLRLIELLMERVGAMREETERVDYAAQYAFRSEEKLLEEGLIKTAIVEKSDLDF